MLPARLMALIFWIGFTVLTAGVASGQDFPSKPIRIIAPEPGGGSDFAARLIAQGISAPIGQPVIVENRPAGLVGELVAKASPDGYTIGIIGAPAWITPLLQKTPYDPVKDFSPVTWVTATPHLLVVHPSVPAKSVKELIELAKAKPGVLNYSSGPAGGEAHLAGELFKSMADVDIVRVTYKGGSAQGLIAVVAGETQLMLNNAVAAAPHLKSGKLRALAITTLQPSTRFPELPTLTASGLPGYESITILGILAPAGTPASIINLVNQQIVRFLNRTDVKEKFSGLGAEVVANSPAEFAAKIKSEMAKWGKVIKDAGIKAD